MMGGWLRRHEDETVTIAGIDHGGAGTVLAENKDYITIKWPAHNAWAGIGITAYHPAVTAVYRKVYRKTGEDADTHLEYAIEWENTRKKKQPKGGRK